MEESEWKFKDTPMKNVYPSTATTPADREFATVSPCFAHRNENDPVNSGRILQKQESKKLDDTRGWKPHVALSGRRRQRREIP